MLIINDYNPEKTKKDRCKKTLAVTFTFDRELFDRRIQEAMRATMDDIMRETHLHIN